MKARDWLTPDECEALHKIIVARGASAVALAFAVSASTLNMLAAGYAASSAAVSRTRAAMAREST